MAAATTIQLLAATTSNNRRRAILMSNDKFRTTQIVVVPKASASKNKENKTIKTSSKSKKLKQEEVDNGDQKKKEQTLMNNAEIEKSESSDVMKRLDEVVNPVGLGRKSRQIFDQVWKKFSNLGQLSRTEYDEGSSSNLLVYGDTVPDAQNTTVLVVGATSRIGRLVVRKLMLRGYSVKAYRCGLRMHMLR